MGNGDSTPRVAVVTGGSRGIGAAVVRKLAEDGLRVVLGYRAKAAEADALVAELRANGHQARAVRADVTDPDRSRALVDAAVGEFGRVDVAVSNAGVEHFGALSAITLDDVHRVFDVNVAGQLFFVQAAAAAMTDGGRIVLTSSVSARIAVREHALYAASKAAVSALARNLAVELGERGITINAIAPGGTQTDMADENARHYTHPALRDVDPDAVLRAMTSAGRLATVEEVAAVVAFLVSPSASYVSGATIAVDGGWIG